MQVVDRIYDEPAAAAFGLTPGQVCVMIHCGSRGLGHQICSDHVRRMLAAAPRYQIVVPDPQLACAPVDSPEGRGYLGAMAAAANYGRANRQLLTEAARGAFERALGSGLDLVYDVSHNLAKLETHLIDGEPRLLCVHRKGATRAWPPGHPDLPADLAPFGQPVLVPGSMGTASYVLAGVAGSDAFHSTCHGAGRVLSRHAATRRIRGRGAARPARVRRRHGARRVHARPGRGGTVRVQGRRRSRAHLRASRPRPPGRPAAAIGVVKG